MSPSKKDIINQLQKEMLYLQGFKTPVGNIAIDAGLGPIAKAFPNHVFPTGAIHEFISTAAEQAAAASGFIAGLLATLMHGERVCVWISSSRTIFPPALIAFGVQPHQIIFIDGLKEKEALWVMEEALKYQGLAVVVGEIQEISFIASRRLQLAVEQSRVTGFLLRHNPRNVNTIACVSRWQITTLPSELEDDMPGVGFPRWNISLLKIRNGKPGSWQVEWSAGLFRQVAKAITALPQEQKRKAG
jgi:protein ImuA